MPAKSAAQRGLMGLVLQFKDTGRMPKAAGGKPLPKSTQADVRSAAKSMTRAQVVDFVRKKKR